MKSSACYNIPRYTYSKDRKEISFKYMLLDFIKSFNLDIKPQYQCGKYRVDFYIPTIALAIEYDEEDHRYYNKNDENRRQEYIENTLGCKFVRLSDKDSHAYNLGKVAKSIQTLQSAIIITKHTRDKDGFIKLIPTELGKEKLKKYRGIT